MAIAGLLLARSRFKFWRREAEAIETSAEFNTLFIHVYETV